MNINFILLYICIESTTRKKKFQFFLCTKIKLLNSANFHYRCVFLLFDKKISRDKNFFFLKTVCTARIAKKIFFSLSLYLYVHKKLLNWSTELTFFFSSRGVVWAGTRTARDRSLETLKPKFKCALIENYFLVQDKLNSGGGGVVFFFFFFY